MLKSCFKHFWQSFIESSQKFYHAGLEQADFKNAAEDSRRQINGWVEKKTEGECSAELPAVFNVSQGLHKQLYQGVILSFLKQTKTSPIEIRLWLGHNSLM